MKTIIDIILILIWTIGLTLLFRNTPNNLAVLSWSGNRNGEKDCLFYWKKVNLTEYEGTSIYCLDRHYK